MGFIRFIVVAPLAVALATASAGCGRSADSVEATAQAASSTPAQAPTPSPTSPPAASPSPTPPPAPAVVPPVPFEDLVALMPDLPGWTRSTPTGQQISTLISYSKANAEYVKGESTIRLEISDSGFNSLLLSPLSMMLVPTYGERTSSGYKKFAAIRGTPGFESWNDETKDAEVTALAAGRFIVFARGTDVPDVNTVRALVEAVDLGRLKQLGPRQIDR